MLNETEKTTALEIVLKATDPEQFGAIDDWLCGQFPTITTDDLIAHWRKAGARRLAEADALEARAHGS